MNRTVFFNFVRKAPFGGTISQNQVDGLTFLLDYKEHSYPDLSNEELAYVLATVFHETASTMQPIKELGSTAYLKAKKYYPYYGRGYVQITWDYNYEKFGIKDNPDQALIPETAAFILFDGMVNAKFTKYKLSDFFGAGKADPEGARKIVNGTDKAKLIAGYYKNFLDSLTAATESTLPITEQQIKVTAEDAKPLPTVGKTFQDPTVITTAGVAGVAALITALGALATQITNPYSLAVVAIMVAGAGVVYYIQSIKKKDTPV